MSAAPIAEYLDQLERELRVHRAPRRRLLAETADHLRSCAEELAAQGVPAEEAERRAVERFGAAAVVARRFAHAAASSSAERALVWVATAFVGYAVAFVVFAGAAPSWLVDFPQGALSVFALQVALVALTLSWLRALGSRTALVIAEPQLGLLGAGALLSALALLAGAGAELVFALTRPAAAPWGDVKGFIAVYAVAALAVLAAVFVAVDAAARVRLIAALPEERAAPASAATASLVDDVAASAPRLAGLAATALAHPARSCGLVACCAFVVVSAAGASGTDAWHHASLAIGALATGTVEGAAVVLAYLAFGRVLGLRPARRPSSTGAR